MSTSTQPDVEEPTTTLTAEQCRRLETGLDTDRLKSDAKDADAHLKFFEGVWDTPTWGDVRKLALAKLGARVEHTVLRVDSHVKDLTKSPLYSAAKSIFAVHSNVEPGQPSIRKGPWEMSGTIEDVENNSLDLGRIAKDIRFTDPAVGPERIRTILTLRYALQINNGWEHRRKRRTWIDDPSGGHSDITSASKAARLEGNFDQDPLKQSELLEAEHGASEGSYKELADLASFQQSCYAIQMLLDALVAGSDPACVPPWLQLSERP